MNVKTILSYEMFQEEFPNASASEVATAYALMSVIERATHLLVIEHEGSLFFRAEVNILPDPTDGIELPEPPWRR